MPTTKSTIRGVPMQGWQIRALPHGMSQFRVPMKKQPTDEQWIDGDDRLGFTLEWDEEAQGGQVVYNRSEKITPPYRPGEVLFVRETFMHVGGGIVYRADIHLAPDWKPPRRKCWSPPQHMREVDSRKLRIKITSVGLGRRQEISEEDALACGADTESEYGSLCVNIQGSGFGANDLPRGSAVLAVWKRLWDAQHRKRGNGWALNGWDWTCGFELTD